MSELALSGLLRISTHHRIFTEPSATQEALAFCEALLASRASIRVRSGPRHWTIFSELVARHQPRGNDVTDTYLAALALENGATWVSADRAFARYEGLHVLNPLTADSVALDFASTGSLDATFVPDRLLGLVDRTIGAEHQEPVEAAREPAVVGDRDYRALERLKPLLQRLGRLDVEVVRRLVQQQQGGT